jgi:hypothetical protein
MAANYRIAEPYMGAVPVTQTNSFVTSGSQANPVFLPHRLGMQARAFDAQTGTNLGAGIFQYCVGSSSASSVGVGDWVQIVGNTAIPLAAANSVSAFPVGIAAGNLSNTNVAGWVQIQGLVDYGRCTDSAVVAGNPLYICAGTTGLALSNVVTGNQIYGAVAYTSASSSASRAASYQLNFPRLLHVATTSDASSGF